MTDFLENLAARSFGSVSIIRPRVASLFEPLSVADAARDEEPHAIESESEHETDWLKRESRVTRQEQENASRSANIPVPDVRSSPTGLAREGSQPETAASRAVRSDQSLSAEQVGSFRSYKPHEANADRPEPKSRTVEDAVPVHSGPKLMAPIPHVSSQEAQIVPVEPAPLLPAAPIRKLATQMGESVRDIHIRPRTAGMPNPIAESAARSSEPDVHVTIGRIEVRAIPESSPKRSSRTSSPVMSLEEYLRGRAPRGGV